MPSFFVSTPGVLIKNLITQKKNKKCKNKNKTVRDNLCHFCASIKVITSKRYFDYLASTACKYPPRTMYDVDLSCS